MECITNHNHNAIPFNIPFLISCLKTLTDVRERKYGKTSPQGLAKGVFQWIYHSFEVFLLCSGLKTNGPEN